MAKLILPALGLAADFGQFGAPTKTAVLALKESSTYGIALALENRDSSRAWSLGIDANTLADGIFFLDDMTTGAHALTIAPITMAAKFFGSVTIAAGGFNVQAGTSAVQALTATSLQMGSANHRTGGVTTGVGAATTIYTQALAYVEVLFVIGDDGAGNMFCDVVAQANGGTPHAIVTGTIAGAPAARTYSATGSALKLAMASGSYTIRTIPFEVA